MNLEIRAGTTGRSDNGSTATTADSSRNHASRWNFVSGDGEVVASDNTQTDAERQDDRVAGGAIVCRRDGGSVAVSCIGRCDRPMLSSFRTCNPQSGGGMVAGRVLSMDGSSRDPRQPC